MQNFQVEIAGYATPLGMTVPQVTAAQEICAAFIGAFNATEQCRMSMIAMTQWRDLIFTGTPSGGDAPLAPVFPVVPDDDFKIGAVTEFFKLRDRITVSPGYTLAIGGDLGLVGAGIVPPAPDTVAPELKTSTTVGY